MGEEFKTFKFFAKKIIPKEILKKIKKIEDKHEKIDTLKHAISSNLDLKLHRIEMDLKDLNKKEVDVFVIFAKANLLKMKIKYFNTTFHKKDFEIIVKLFKEIEQELDEI
jgi:predicted site-specific integrase-resolvase